MDRERIEPVHGDFAAVVSGAEPFDIHTVRYLFLECTLRVQVGVRDCSRRVHTWGFCVGFIHHTRCLCVGFISLFFFFQIFFGSVTLDAGHPARHPAVPGGAPAAAASRAAAALQPRFPLGDTPTLPPARIDGRMACRACTAQAPRTPGAVRATTPRSSHPSASLPRHRRRIALASTT